jgi:hypothetical protein
MDHWRRCEARGYVIIERFTDNLVVGFEYESDGGREGGGSKGAVFSVELAIPENSGCTVPTPQAPIHRGR